ncbi:MAG: DUF5719 family protein [Actinomycetota bacterium]|nr:DUF5719 family protein [Actinomycetota bacterium]
MTNRGGMAKRWGSAAVLAVMLIFLSGFLPLVPGIPFGSEEALAQTGTISGRVTSASEPGGVENVSVYVLDLTETPETYVSTKADGTYTATVSAPGDYKVKFSDWSNGYITEYYNDKADFDSADTVSVPDGGSVTGIDAYLSSPVTPTVTSITPNTGRNDQVVQVTDLAGSNFQTGAAVHLEREGQPNIYASGVNVVSAARITCTLDLSKAQAGGWDVVVTNTGSKQGRLARGFTITQAPDVDAPGYDFYFAEGYTGAGFQEYLCLGNPQAETASTTITYMFPDGTTQEQSLDVGASSRTTVNVNQVVGENREVSCKIEADQEIVVERPMYFNYQGKWAGGHDTMGAVTTARTWYFAEGYTGAGFDEWICVLNPGDDTAALTFNFQTQEEGEKVVEGFTVAGHSRASFKVNDILGAEYQTSLMLESDQPIVAERPMYFDYGGTAARGWQGGHCVIGVHELSGQYYFAEGTTRDNFEEWLTLQNPGDEGINVDASYQLGVGQEDTVDKSYYLEPASRSTVFVPNEVGYENDVSVYLSSPSLFLAERPMYFDYGYLDLSAQGGHCVIGASEIGDRWFLAEGYTGDGFNQWLCLQNAGDQDAQVTITYYTQEEGALDPRETTVPAGTRGTVMVNVDAGPGYQLSCQVESTQPIMVERPMYFVFRGWPGGHDVVGYMP